MSDRARIPRPTVKRLSLYLRVLEARPDSVPTISSRQLGNALGLTDAQVRKDLAYFGQFGHPGIGYRIDELRDELSKILGIDREWRAAVVGAGNIGRAVSSYAHLERRGFTITAIFDNDPAIVGTEIGGHRVHAIADLGRRVREQEITIGIVAVPADVAQDVTNTLIASGVRGILNFAPVRLDIDRSVAVVSVDLSVSLEQLACKITLSDKAMLENSDRPGADDRA